MTQATPVTEATLTVEQIETAIERLSPTEMDRLRSWLAEKAEAAWDEQIKDDLAQGRLDSVLAEVRADIKAGRYQDL